MKGEDYSYYTSKNWKNWVAILDFRICRICRNHHGMIYPIEDNKNEAMIPVHFNCRCKILAMVAMLAGTATNRGIDGADWWLLHYGILPHYYISKNDAHKAGWIPKQGNLHEVLPGRMIYGGIFKNTKGKLPNKKGRIWYEADINYSFSHRNLERILFSNDSLIFITKNHYDSFIEII